MKCKQRWTGKKKEKKIAHNFTTFSKTEFSGHWNIIYNYSIMSLHLAGEKKNEGTFSAWAETANKTTTTTTKNIYIYI